MDTIDVDEIKEIKENIIKRDIIKEMKSAIIEQVKKEIISELKEWLKEPKTKSIGVETTETTSI